LACEYQWGEYLVINGIRRDRNHHCHADLGMVVVETDARSPSNFYHVDYYFYWAGPLFEKRDFIYLGWQ
jgi:hypothetical protein